MKRTIVIALATASCSCVGLKRARPPEPAQMVGEWLGNSGVETFFVTLTTNGTGTSIYILGNETHRSVSTVTQWRLKDFQMTISCVGVTYPDETYTMTGGASGHSMVLTVRGRNKA